MALLQFNFEIQKLDSENTNKFKLICEQISDVTDNIEYTISILTQIKFAPNENQHQGPPANWTNWPV